MKNAVKDHIDAIIWSFKKIIQGKFILFFIPGIVIALLFVSVFGAVKTLDSWLSIVNYVPWVGSYMLEGKNIFFGWLDGLSLFIYQFLIISVLSPFHTVLSEKVDTEITNQKFEFSWEKIVSDIIRTLGVVILGGVLYLILKLFFSSILWTIGLSVITPLISALLIGFFTGFNSYDYTLERYNINVFNSWKFARKHPFYMLITGGIFSCFLFIPYIGVVLAPVFLTMIGTFCYLRIQNREGALSKESSID